MPWGSNLFCAKGTGGVSKIVARNRPFPGRRIPGCILGQILLLLLLRNLKLHRDGQLLKQNDNRIASIGTDNSLYICPSWESILIQFDDFKSIFDRHDSALCFGTICKIDQNENLHWFETPMRRIDCSYRLSSSNSS